MSSLLYRWGRSAFVGRWWVAGIWAAIIVGIASVMVVSPPQLSNEIRIDGTPAQEVIDDLTERLPEAAGGQGILAFHSTDHQRVDQGGKLIALLDAVDRVYRTEHVIDVREAMAAEVAKGPDSRLLQASAAIAQAQGPGTQGRAAPAVATPLVVQDAPVPGVLISPDGQTALFQFTFDAQTFELPEGTIDDTIAVAATAAGREHIDVLPSSTMVAVPELVGVGEIVGIVIAALVLIVTLGSLVAAGLPLASALSGVAVGVGGAFAISSFVPMHSLTAVLGLMLGLAVGIDYALFIVNRQRHFILDQGLTAHEATGRAIGTAGSAVFFAGTTVVIALLALAVVQIQLLTTMALTAAATVVIAVLSALTLLPALLGFVGERICSPGARATAQAAHENGSVHRVANGWSRMLVKHRYVAALGALVIGGTLAAPMLDMDLGLPSGASYHPDTPQRQSYDVVGDSFGPGYNGPLVIVASAPTPIPADELAGIHSDLGAIDGVTAVALEGLAADGTTALFSVIPDTTPTSQETGDLVSNIRDRAGAFADAHGVTIGVTGFSALAIDVSERLTDVLPLYIAVVVGLSLVVLLAVFRSVLVPIKATVGFLLSVAATFGATTAVFQWGWAQTLFGMDATSPVLSLLPVIITGVLYGLAMDYEVFLVSSMKEAHVHGYAGRDSVVRGFGVASRVVVAAAIIMISVFAGFVYNPDPMIAQVGFALAFGIVVDAFLVRMTLVPAVMAIFGDNAWWLPRWLDRILPDLDIEGDKLTARLDRPRSDTPESVSPGRA
ncbi:MMPL family transporter [Gordonia sp. NPDC003376]